MYIQWKHVKCTEPAQNTEGLTPKLRMGKQGIRGRQCLSCQFHDSGSGESRPPTQKEGLGKNLETPECVVGALSMKGRHHKTVDPQEGARSGRTWQQE